MKSIKEKAEERIPYPCPMWYAGDDEGYEESKKDVDTKRHIFELGANAVLEKIESIIENTSGECEVYHDNLYMWFQKLVKELKGE